MSQLEQAKLTIPVASVVANGGYLDFTVEVRPDGRAFLWLLAGRMGGQRILANLDESTLAELRTAVESVARVVEELKGEGRIERLELNR